jgi:hypothetical protein
MVPAAAPQWLPLVVVAAQHWLMLAAQHYLPMVHAVAHHWLVVAVA